MMNSFETCRYASAIFCEMIRRERSNCCSSESTPENIRTQVHTSIVTPAISAVLSMVSAQRPMLEPRTLFKNGATLMKNCRVCGDCARRAVQPVSASLAWWKKAY